MPVQKKLSLCLYENMMKITATDCVPSMAGNLFLVSLFCDAAHLALVRSRVSPHSVRLSRIAFGEYLPPHLKHFPYSSKSESCYSPCVAYRLQGALLMEWVTPQHEEIDLNCEISSYANAEL